MKKAILATKVGMTQIFNEDGVLTPVTVLQAGPPSTSSPAAGIGSAGIGAFLLSISPSIPSLR